MTLDLGRDTIFVTLAGSQAHGTAHASSDIDLRGVCIAPLALRVSLFEQFEQFEGTLEGPIWATVRARLETHPAAATALGTKTESVIFDIAKFLTLCASANPNALEVLFADQRDWLYETPLWQRVHAHRREFLSKKVQQTYTGYAMAQLSRIKTHRGWLLSPPTHQPTRAEHDLPNDSLEAERRYRAAMKRWDAYRAWKTERNPARAELEQRYGYDTKHAMHLIRLMQTGLELLESGELRVRRSDADELRAVREGALSFDALVTRAAELEAQMHDAASRTSLPAEIDLSRVDALALELIRAGAS